MNLKLFKKCLSSVIGLVLFLNLTGVNAYAAGYSVAAYATDSIAGESLEVRSSRVPDGKNVYFKLESPGKSEIVFSSVSNENGIAYYKISDYYLRESGVYQISASLDKGKNFGVVDDFEVFPAYLSDEKSTIYPKNQVAQASVEPVVITVRLQDSFRNPIQGHEIVLKSSNSDDSISYFGTNVSDEFGEVTFSVKSPNIGSATYHAYDKTVGKTLGASSKVLYFSDSKYIFTNSAFNNAYAASGAASGPIDHFEFEDVPETINAGEPVSMTVVAYDASDEQVLDYSGTVRFSVLGDNSTFVSLPEDFTFSPDDLGEHTFSLAFNFQQAGTYNVEVRDIDNTAIYTVETFEVGSGGSVTPPPSSSGVAIINPVSGTYSNNIQVISGTAEPGAQLKVYDNEIEISSVVADVSGNFTYTTPPLTDGMHQIYVAQITDIGTVLEISETVNIQVDTSAPELGQVTINPPGDLVGGANFAVRFDIADVLTQASVIFNDNILNMLEISPGSYEASLVAPSDPGTYSLSFIVVDELGNESRFDDAAMVTVVGNGGTEIYVGSVSGLYAVPSANKVTLSWLPPSDSTFDIQAFRIFYGTSPNQLTQAVDTFDDSTTWYVPNLINDTEYYFAVAAIDENGNMSDEISSVIPATPNPVVIDTPPPDVEMGFGGAEALGEMEEDASDAGPSTKYIILLAAILGIFYTQRARRKYLLALEDSDLDVDSCKNSIRQNIRDIFTR